MHVHYERTASPTQIMKLALFRRRKTFPVLRIPAGCIVILFLILIPFAAQALLLTTDTPEGPVVVSAEDRPFSQGDAVKLTLKSPPLTRAHISFNGRTGDFVPAPGGACFFSLVGIGCEMKPGIYPVVIDIEYPERGGISLAGEISVIEKKFRKERFRVMQKYVTPPPEVQERIKKEQELLRRIYSEFTPAWQSSGRFEAPLTGRITGKFGDWRVYTGANPHTSRHRGMDLAAPRGTPVKASNAGTVVLARNLYYTGKTVILHHGNRLFSLYCHMSDLKVREGTSVLKGAVIGRVGSTGRSTGPHLHWGIRIDDQYVDPDLMTALALD